MNKQPGSAPSEQAREMQEIAHKILQIVLKNWGFKLIALLAAIFLWAGLISQDPTLTRERTFTGVTISVTGQDSMKRNGFIVISDLDALRRDATMRVEVPQMQYDNVSASTYNPRIDLTRIKETGKQTLKVTTTTSSTYGSVMEIDPDTIDIQVEEYITRYRIPVLVYTTGEPPKGFYATTPSVDPPVVAISGPRSLVEKIVRAEVTLNQANLPARAGVVRTAVPLKLVDTKGNEVANKLIEVTSESVLLDSVIIEQTLYASRSLDLSQVGLVTGQPAEGYEIKTVTITPSTITAAGRDRSLAALDTLYADSQVDVGDMTESFTQQIRVRKPSELNYLSADTVTVAVEIGPVIKSRTFEDMKIDIISVPDGYTASLATKTCSVTVMGAQLWVDSIRKANITVRVDAAGLEEGEHEVPVNLVIANDNGQSYTMEASPALVMLELKQK